MAVSTFPELFGVLAALAIPNSIIGFALFIWRRKCFPCTQMQWPVMLLFWIGAFTNHAFYCLDAIIDFDCVWAFIVQTHMAYLAVTALVLRLFRLRFLYYINVERLKNYALDSSGLYKHVPNSPNSNSVPDSPTFTKRISPVNTTDSEEFANMSKTQKFSHLPIGRIPTSASSEDSRQTLARVATTSSEASDHGLISQTTTTPPSPKLKYKQHTRAATRCITTRGGAQSVTGQGPRTTRSPSISLAAGAWEALENVEENRWFESRRHYVKPKFMFIFFLILQVPIIAGTMVTYYFTADGGASDPLCSLNEPARILSNIAQVLLAVVYVLAGHPLRDLREGFYSKTEVFLGVPIVLLAVVPTFLVYRLDFGLDFFILHVLPAVFLHVAWVVFFHKPVWHSWAFARKQAKRLERLARRRKSMTPDTPLIDVLCNKKYEKERKEFEEHLIREFSIEALLFWDQVRNFVGEAFELSDNELSRRAVKIYRDFIRDDAPSQVNLDAKIRQGIVSKLESSVPDLSPDIRLKMIKSRVRLPSDIFGDAKRRVFKLMENDSYMRWQLARMHDGEDEFDEDDDEEFRREEMLSQVLEKDKPAVELSSVQETAKAQAQDEVPMRVSYAKEDYVSYSDHGMGDDDDDEEEGSTTIEVEYTPREERTIIHRNEKDQPTHILHQERTILYVPDDLDDEIHPAPISPRGSGPLTLADIETSISGPGTPRSRQNGTPRSRQSGTPRSRQNGQRV